VRTNPNANRRAGGPLDGVGDGMIGHGPEEAEAELAHWSAVAEERRERGRKFGEEIERDARGYDVKVVLGEQR
jgi:hypothetical protein